MHDDAQIRRLVPGDEPVAVAASRTFGDEGGLDASEFLRRPETALIVAEDEAGVAGWVYGHELAPRR